jgi:adenine-specific DNA-methyltransferase
MAKSNTRLELTWIGKENRPKLEPRVLIEAPDKSYHAPHRVGENDLFDNRLIFGDRYPQRTEPGLIGQEAA